MKGSSKIEVAQQIAGWLKQEALKAHDPVRKAIMLECYNMACLKININEPAAGRTRRRLFGTAHPD
jgi:hypothetical protein